jgi:hypothetical protein
MLGKGYRGRDVTNCNNSLASPILQRVKKAPTPSHLKSTCPYFVEADFSTDTGKADFT